MAIHRIVATHHAENKPLSNEQSFFGLKFQEVYMGCELGHETEQGKNIKASIKAAQTLANFLGLTLLIILSTKMTCIEDLDVLKVAGHSFKIYHLLLQNN